MIFKLVTEDDPDDLASISLVCKRFLSITNRMKTSLTVSDLVAHQLPRALRRFRYLKSICIDTKFHRDVDGLVCQISRSKLEHLEALELLYPDNLPREGLSKLGMSAKGLKELRCVGISLCDDDLVMLTDLFPSLEEVCSNCFERYELVTDLGVEVLASKLRRLNKISLCDCNAATDEAIMCLSSNCKDLRSVEIQYCRMVTENGIGFLMRHSSKLTSLTLVLFGGQSFSNDKSQFTMENSIAYATNLEQIKVWDMDISDNFLSLISKSCPSVKKIDLSTRSPWRSFTIKGLIALSKACSSLKEIYPRASWLTDEHMFEISEHLCGITHINLSNCASLTNATFFTLTRNCPLLESLVMDNTKIGASENEGSVLYQNYGVNHLSLSSNELMNDTTLLTFVSTCPNLEYLDISNCGQDVTNKGISNILRLCPKIRHLVITGMKVSNFLGPKEEMGKLKLRAIEADQTRINDEVLGVIGERCPDLEEVDIGRCQKVTNTGVNLIVSKCRKLKKINMHSCKNVSVDVLDWMVASRPSIREIVPPRGFVPTEQQRNLVLAKGCLLLSGGSSHNDLVYLAEF